MAWAATTWLAIGAIAAGLAGAGGSAYSAQVGRAASNEAADKAQSSALEQIGQQEKAIAATTKASDEAMRRANQQSANANSVLAAAQQAAKGGVGGTMLTGPSGVNASNLSLGKSTLLGS